MNTKNLTTLFIFVLCAVRFVAFSQTTIISQEYEVTDSMSYVAESEIAPDSVYEHKSCLRKICESRPFRMTYAAVPLIASGFIVKSSDKQLRERRNEYAHEYNTTIDDYLQYSPAVLMLGLKIAGVKGRSSWLRMLSSDAFSVGLMALTVNTIKHTADVERPDGSNKHSFPSGHTATAFMLATMLHKEYGGVSKWYSIAGYTVATYTGVSRILNNKHWLSDVLVGAGIGILSTEVGYFLADLIFKDKGLNSFDRFKDFDIKKSPSFLGVRFGFNFALNEIRLSDNRRIALSTGVSAGVEGAYFATKNIGVGGMFNVSGFPVTINSVNENKQLNMLSAGLGPYFSLPIIPQILVGAKLLATYSDFNKCTMSSAIIGDTGGLGFSTGCTLSIMPSDSFSLKLFADYNLCNPYVKSVSDFTSFITLGSVAAITF